MYPKEEGAGSSKIQLFIVIRLIVVIILKCMEILNHDIVEQELTWCCRSVILQKQTYKKRPGLPLWYTVKNPVANARTQV